MHQSRSSQDEVCRERVVSGEFKDGNQANINMHSMEGGRNLHISRVDNFEDQTGPSNQTNTYNSIESGQWE